MDLLGDRLKEAREEKGLSIDQVSRDTNISKSFIAAIEVEDFSAFPGETYVIGFIRNYAEYLGFDGSDFIQMYRNLVIQEQPLPLEELVSVSHRGSIKVPIVIGSIVLVCALAVTLVLFLTGVIQVKVDSGLELPHSAREGKSYEFNGTKALFDVQQGDSINLTEEKSGADFSILVDGLEVRGEEKDLFVYFVIEGGDGFFFELKEGASTLLDLDKDKDNDIQFSLIKNEEDELISIELNRKFIEILPFSLEDSLLSEALTKEIFEKEIGSVILESLQKEPIEIVLTVGTGYFIQYKSDGGEILSSLKKKLTLQAENGAIFWIGNRYGASLQVNGKTVALPNQEGPASSFFISWKKKMPGEGFELGIFPLNKIYE